jgi:hypothetical protein
MLASRAICERMALEQLAHINTAFDDPMLDIDLVQSRQKLWCDMYGDRICHFKTH